MTSSQFPAAAPTALQALAAAATTLSRCRVLEQELAGLASGNAGARAELAVAAASAEADRDAAATAADGSAAENPGLAGDLGLLAAQLGEFARRWAPCGQQTACQRSRQAERELRNRYGYSAGEAREMASAAAPGDPCTRPFPRNPSYAVTVTWEGSGRLSIGLRPAPQEGPR